MPDGISVWSFVVVAILVALSAFFSGTETAFSSLSKVRVKSLIEENNKRAEIAEKDLDYSVVPIKKLVSIQLESGMIVADWIKNNM